MPYSHFQTISRSDIPSDGKLYIIGDIHGEIEAFSALVAELSDNDVLVVVGDIIDRGRDAAGKNATSAVLDLILEKNAMDSGPKIYSIKGNHEHEFLAVIDILNAERPFNPENKDKLVTCFRNGGAWLFKHPQDSRQNHALLVWSAHYMAGERSEHYQRAERFILNYIEELSQASNISDYLIDDLSQYEAYIRQLPYVIKIDDALNPAWVVHSDLAMTDSDLNLKMSNHQNLQDAEIDALINTRPQYFSHVRTKDDVKVYCGHNIIDENPTSECAPTFAVRDFSNHINLDSGAYFTKNFLVVDHFQYLAFIKAAPSAKSHAFIEASLTELNDYLARFNTLTLPDVNDSRGLNASSPLPSMEESQQVTFWRNTPLDAPQAEDRRLIISTHNTSSG